MGDAGWQMPCFKEEGVVFQAAKAGLKVTTGHSKVNATGELHFLLSKPFNSFDCGPHLSHPGGFVGSGLADH